MSQIKAKIKPEVGGVKSLIYGPECEIKKLNFRVKI